MKWRQIDVEYLKMHYTNMPTEEIQNNLVDFRGLNSIRAKANVLGLKKVTRTAWTLEENLIVCNVYLNEVIVGSRAAYINKKLVEAGYQERSSNTINAKFYNFRYLATKHGYKSYSNGAQKAFEMLAGWPGYPKH